jgi:hypothetical protein
MLTLQVEDVFLEGPLSQLHLVDTAEGKVFEEIEVVLSLSLDDKLFSLVAQLLLLL